MAKYDQATRRKIVDDYLSGSGGFRELARRYGIGRSTLRRWVSGYRIHGDAGLRKKSSRYDADFKLHVLHYMRSNELSGQQVSVLFDLRDAGAIGKWQRLYDDGGYEALKPRPRRRRPTMTRVKPTSSKDPIRPAEERTHQELLDENEYLRAEVAYLKKLQELRREKALAAKQAKPCKL